jgi:pimeloyl-ACP methyl ester carboxylesterase
VCGLVVLAVMLATPACGSDNNGTSAPSTAAPAASTTTTAAVGATTSTTAVPSVADEAYASRSEAQRFDPTCPADADPNIAALLGDSPAAPPELARAASPVTYLHPGQRLPAIFIAHGDADCVEAYQQSVELHDAIEAVAPGRSQLTIVPGSGHYTAFDFSSQSQAIAEFLASTIGAP